MLDTYKLKRFIKRAFTPITIMFIPHTNRSPLNVRFPFIGIFISVILWCFGAVYIFSLTMHAVEYYEMRQSLNYYSQQFLEWKNTVSAIKRAETEFKKLFSLSSKEDVLENIDISDSGSIDMEDLKKEISKSIETIGEIREYLHIQRDIYFATPMGVPVDGWISSGYGKRIHPISGKEEFHAGIDIAISPGTAVRATADGIVSFSGWSGGSGKVVVLEHGHGFSTLYAHNKINTVNIGQRVKRGDIIGYVGATGNATGPHVHYEVWKDGRHVNPKKYIGGSS
ncbi:MAG: M23 family metallopeptidase [Nitrospirota bacterium]